MSFWGQEGTLGERPVWGEFKPLVLSPFSTVSKVSGQGCPPLGV